MDGAAFVEHFQRMADHTILVEHFESYAAFAAQE